MNEILKGCSKGQYTIIEQPFVHGDNCNIANYVHIRPGVVIGDNVDIRDGVWIGPGVKIGSWVRIANRTQVCTGSVVGNDVFIGPGVQFTNSHKFAAKPENGPMVESGVKIGARAVILGGVTLAKNCTIGAGAVVTKSTEPGKTYMGVPAREV